MDSSSSSAFFHQNANNPNSNATFFSPQPHIITPNSTAPPASAATAPPASPAKRKRGRPRKYGGGRGGGASSLSSSSLSPPTHTSTPLPSASPKKPKLNNALSLKHAGQGFTPHVIMVPAGEDVAISILSFIQQSKRAVCILSASGSLCNASLCQSAMLGGGNVTYEGRFEILSLSGSFLCAESGGGGRNGGMNICLSGTDGRVVGGGVGGPLMAAGPVQVIIGSFLIETDKKLATTSSLDNSASRMSRPGLAGTTLLSPVCHESSFRITPSEGSEDHTTFGGSGNNFMLQTQGMSIMPSRLSMDWRARQDIEQGKVCYSPDDDEDEGNFRD